MDREYGEDEVTDDACGIHLDHSLLTGLCESFAFFTLFYILPETRI
jgi:hypothetical protein